MVTKRQVEKMHQEIAKGGTQTTAADCGNMDVKTARKYLRSGLMPAEMQKPRTHRTRPDAFADVLEEAHALLEREPGLLAKTVFEELRRRHPEQFRAGQLRTLQRRVKKWRAMAGPHKEVMFAQEHRPGVLGAYDFTCMNELMVTIAGEHFKHLVYHFVLTFSNWEWGRICQSETFENVTVGLQNALWALGGVPAEVRSDNLTAAVWTIGREKGLQARYAALLRHYEIVGRAINAGKGHENGDVEQSHHQFKRALDQALMLRGSRDFESQAAYAAFLQEVLAARNAQRVEKVQTERVTLGHLPATKLEVCRALRVRVGAGSTINVERNVYSVDSRLIGEQVETRVYAERIEVWHGQQLVDILPRLAGRGNHRIEYRHVIDWLVRKPGAFAGYCYREDLFPSTRFRMAYDELRRTHPLLATKEYLAILNCAAKESETRVEAALVAMLTANDPISATAVRARVMAEHTPPVVTLGTVAAVNLAVYDALLEGTPVQEVGHAHAA
jgi:transposase